MIPHRSRRCSHCKVNWPPSAVTFDPCPVCGAMTYCSKGFPIPLDDALSRKSHADFERYELERIPVQTAGVG